MSIVPMINGMTGKKDANILGNIPSTGFEDETRGNRKPPQYKREPIAPRLYPSNIDYSTRREVLPCKGITHHVLRQPPVPAAGGMKPIGGNGRHSARALSQERPTNLPILPFSNPFNSAMNNPLKSPN